MPCRFSGYIFLGYPFVLFFGIGIALLALGWTSISFGLHIATELGNY
jgi:hypothetical protein